MYIILSIAFLINIGVLIYACKYADKLMEHTDKKEISTKIFNTNYSLMGITVYVIARGFYGNTLNVLILKVGLFNLSINVISNNLKQYYNVTSFKNKINITLIIGALINVCIFIYLNFILNELDKRTLVSLRDITFIISSLFIIPYLKKAQFSNS